MNIYFSNNLKKYRIERGITQESLADFLGVTFQAVSKWERGENYPDIETIINLVVFFKTSVDDLLGVNATENEQKILRIIEEYDNLTDGELRHKIITDAISEFPTDFRLQLRQMTDLAWHVPKDEYEKNYSKVQSIYDNIQQNCTDDKIRICAKRYLAMYYNTLAHYNLYGITHKDCENIVNQMPSVRDGREFLSSYLFKENKDYNKYAQNAIEEEIYMLFHGIFHCSGAFVDESIPFDFRFHCAKLSLKLFNSFYDDGNYGKMWRNVMYVNGHLGHMYAKIGDNENAIKHLKMSASLAKEFDKMPRITIMHSKLFEGMEFDKNVHGSTFVASSYIKRLITERYPLSDEFRQTDEYKEIISMLDD